jgi:hypothetical protein
MALAIKATIVLVCKAWKSIATEMLYECIRIRHGTHNLLSALESTRYSNPDVASGSEFEFDYGRWVRRIEISTEILDFDPFNPLPLLHILQCCPLVQTVVRSCDKLGSGGSALGSVRRPPGMKFPSFPSIKRIDWWLRGVASRRPGTEVDGISGFLGELVVHSPSLNYLTLSGGGDSLFSAIVGMQPFGGRSGPFNSLTTLRLETKDSHAFFTEPTPLLPNLSHLILGLVYPGVRQFLGTYGHQIRVLEFVDIDTSPYLVPMNHTVGPLITTDVLKACPNLQELNTRLSTGNILFAETIINSAPILLKSLTSIRIQLDDASALTRFDFATFIRYSLICPALERIVLCGARQAWEKLYVGLPILIDHISQTRILDTRFISLEYQES